MALQTCKEELVCSFYQVFSWPARNVHQPKWFYVRQTLKKVQKLKKKKSKNWQRISNLNKMWYKWWLACVECSLAGLMLRDSAHSLLPSRPAHQKLTDHEKLQICTQPSAIAFLSWKISCPEIPDEHWILNHWVFGSSLTLYFWSCNETRIYSGWHLYLQINAI